MSTPTVKQMVPFSGLSNTLTTLLYTVPSATTGIVKEIIICNTAGSIQSATLYMGTGTAFNNLFISGLAFAPGETKFFSSLMTILPSGQKIAGGATANNVMSITVNGVELT